MTAQQRRLAPLRDRLCAGKAGAADQYSLQLSARCVAHHGEALAAARAKPAAVAARRKGAAIPASATKREVELLDAALAAHGDEVREDIGAVTLEVCVLLLHRMLLLTERRALPDPVARLNHIIRSMPTPIQKKLGAARHFVLASVRAALTSSEACQKKR